MEQNTIVKGGVSVQTVSKWENNVCMPDIAMLPDIAKFFHVTVDELLGLSPLAGEKYIPVNSGEKDYWESRLDCLKTDRRIESYCRKQRKVQAYVAANRENLKYLHYWGLLVSYGYK